jgi:hypothetical protein
MKGGGKKKFQQVGSSQAAQGRKSEASRKLIWPGGGKWREEPFI